MKKSVKVLILLFLLAGMMFFGKRFIDTDYFKIQEVLIEGQSKLLKQDIATQLEHMKGKNIVYLNTNEIENLIKTDVRVKKVSVRKLFPSKIEVILEEREPYAYVKKGDKTLLADKDLNIYGDILEDPSKNIPVIEYTSDESLAQIKTILSKIKNKDLYDMISEIKKSDDQKENKYELVLIDGVKIITDTLVNEKKYDEIYKSYKKIKSDQAIQYIDIRFKYFNVK